MRRVLLAVAAALVLVPASPALAASTADADCGFDSVTDASWLVGEPYVYYGVAYGYGVVRSTTAPPMPAGATVRCAFFVNGELVTSADFSGTGVMAGAGPVTFRMRPEDDLDFCTIVDFHDETPTQTTCHSVGGGPQFPPQEVHDLVTGVFEALPVAEAVCAAVADGTVPTQGRLLWTHEGDLYVSDRRVRDCPPHG